MLCKRIIPCLDVFEGRVVKGVHFSNLIDAGDPAEIADAYSKNGADELIFLDITASNENRNIMLDVVRKTASKLFIPLTVGGGIRNIEDIKNTLLAGADKVSINSQAIKNPDFINEAAAYFGSQCIVVAIDTKKIGNRYEVFINGGTIPTKLDAVIWAKEVEKRGAGEILLTSMDKDGTKDGYEIEVTRLVSEAVRIPVIASGGAGKKEDFLNVFTSTQVSAALAASLFHFKEIEIDDLKEYLSANKITIRR